MRKKISFEHEEMNKQMDSLLVFKMTVKSFISAAKYAHFNPVFDLINIQRLFNGHHEFCSGPWRSGH